MAIAPKLEFRQTQALVMTPQLQQAIRLLQLSNLELDQYVEEELERNPMLERAEPEGGESGEAEAPAVADDDAAASDGISDDGLAGDPAATELDGATPPDGGDLGAAEGPLDTAYENDYTNDSAADGGATDDGAAATDGYELGDWASAGQGNGNGNGAGVSLEQVLTSEVTLKEHLRGQMSMLLSDPAERLIGAELIEHLDEAGYLAEDTTFIADRLGGEEELVDAVLAKLQSLDPPGVFAHDLRECLALQLREKDRYDPAMRALVENLNLLAEMDIAQLTEICGVEFDEVEEMIAELKALDPKPGLAFDHDVAAPVVPDVFVEERADGGWSVELNGDTLPRLLVNRQYYAEISRAAQRKEDKTYLSECLQSANWLIKSLDQRARTILSVASELVRQQDAFLANGVHELRPLNLHAIAQAVDIHESTVSRVTNNKYIATPRGI
ncbi:MAG: RNA polymerase factor sigma-54, partial [Alphaproteobacteria bacterium]|nr:RNA polymerase factor sigma-54 [Alphaproteobacteria bacterium]